MYFADTTSQSTARCSVASSPCKGMQEMMKNKIKPQKVNNTTNISVRL